MAVVPLDPPAASCPVEPPSPLAESAVPPLSSAPQLLSSAPFVVPAALADVEPPRPFAEFVPVVLPPTLELVDPAVSGDDSEEAAPQPSTTVVTSKTIVFEDLFMGTTSF